MSSINEQVVALGGAIALTQTVSVLDSAKLRDTIDLLAHQSALGQAHEAAVARWLIWESAQALGIYPASINDLYMARGAGALPNNFTVPAINVRVMTFDCARAAFRAALARNTGTIIFEIARSEMTYTFQRPAEYVASILAAAIKENWNAPVFIQGDHFQVSHARYQKDAATEVQAVRDLTKEAIAAGFYNIDVDTSTLVDLSQPTITAQQTLNATLCAEFTQYIRSLQPKGVQVSVGGEIGEVGTQNSTEAELRAFVEQYNQALGADLVGLSKISVQTGTSHGGVVLADGSIAKVNVDFDTLALLSTVSRDYGAGGAVQHGASTLPPEAFAKIAASGAVEVHLATNFQNMFFDLAPEGLIAEMNAWVQANAQQKSSETLEQFIYKNRKSAIGPFKAAAWNLPAADKAVIVNAWEAQFGKLFDWLNIANTRPYVQRHVRAVPVHKTLADFGVVAVEAEDVSDLSD
jgi:fructose/tagatose bisphosphate aldolase